MSNDPIQAAAPGPFVAEGWEGLVVNDAQGNTIAVAPGAHLGLGGAKSTARLLAASWSLYNAVAVIVNDPRISAWLADVDPQALQQCASAYELARL